jgi:hypothetical protein
MPMTEIQMIEDIFALSDQIRYAAMYRETAATEVQGGNRKREQF